MTTGKLVQNAIIITLSSSMTFPKPTPPPSGGKPPASGARPDHTLPGDLPHPEHPIYYPLPPGAPVDPEYGIPEGAHPDHTLPGAGSTPGTPTHPIVLPEPPPEQGGGWEPVYIWGGGPGIKPPLPIPPDGAAPPEAGSGAKITFKAMWTPDNGWQTIGVIVPGGPHPSPAKK